MSYPSDRNTPDIYHDERQRAEVGEILSRLPTDHPARVAFGLGQGPIAISHLLSDKALVHRVTVAFLDGLNRSLRRVRETTKPGPGRAGK